MLEIQKLTKKYKRVPVVNEVNFTVKPGEILGYLGPNGAGKTTTIKMLTGLIEPSAGTIRYKGKNIHEGKNMLDLKKEVGYIPEQSYIYKHLSAFEYLQLVGRLRCIPEKVLLEKIEGLMEQFDLSREMHNPVSSYSKGMTQKVLLASALLHDPNVLILDEPLSGLDVTFTLVIKDLLAILAKAGKIIVYSSHRLEIIEKVCSTVIILDKGKIVAHNSMEKLREMMNLPSLESIFNELVREENSRTTADAIYTISRSG